MSISTTVIAINIDQARAAIGSRDADLLVGVEETQQSDIKWHNEFLAPEIDDGRAPSMATSLRAVIDGGPFDASEMYDFQYTHAFRLICTYLGKDLYAGQFGQCSSSRLEWVDENLTQLGIRAVRVMDFYDGRPPSPLPSGYRGCGQWSAQACTQALTRWSALTDSDRAAIERDPLAAIDQMAGWLRAASERNCGLIGFAS